jgi:cyanophycinase
VTTLGAAGLKLGRAGFPAALLSVCLLCCSLLAADGPTPYQYFRVGNTNDVSPATHSGFVLMGGGKDLDEAFRWMCEKSGGGDFLVIRATGTDAYNPYIRDLCKQNSVATLVIPDREAANHPAVAEIIRKAEALFISGGDQSNYIKYWQNTPVQDAVNALVRRGVPVGGSSAGLAVLGQFSFSALNDSAVSRDTLADPYNSRVTIARDFLRVPHLQDIITDTHFVARDRQGRLLGFMARILKDGMSKKVRGIGIDEKAAVLMEPDGNARVVGVGVAAYFFAPVAMPEVCEPGKALTFRNIMVYKAPPGATFNLASWTGAGGRQYRLDIVGGVVTSSNAEGAPY